jgi:hypothetical protein
MPPAPGIQTSRIVLTKDFFVLYVIDSLSLSFLVLNATSWTLHHRSSNSFESLSETSASPWAESST